MTDESQARGELITSAIRRADRAFANGFYLEVLALCDSLVSDRIHKIAHYSIGNSLKMRGVNDGLAKLVAAEVVFFDSSLVAETRNWARIRNQAIHGFSKFDEFEGASWRSRISQVAVAAEQGIVIAKRWLREAKLHRI